MNGDEKKYLEMQLTKLEVQFKERWESHGREAKQRQNLYFEKFELIFAKLKELKDYFIKLPCLVHKEKIDNLEQYTQNIIQNHLNHINNRITGLYFTVIGSVILAFLFYIIKSIIK